GRAVEPGPGELDAGVRRATDIDRVHPFPGVSLGQRHHFGLGRPVGLLIVYASGLVRNAPGDNVPLGIVGFDVAAVGVESFFVDGGDDGDNAELHVATSLSWSSVSAPSAIQPGPGNPAAPTPPTRRRRAGDPRRRGRRSPWPSTVRRWPTSAGRVTRHRRTFCPAASPGTG